MKSGNWIPVDKGIVKLLPKNRPFTIIEAYLSFRVDMDNGFEGTINGYSKLWGWSRCKVRRFITDLKTVARHVSDRDETGTRHEVCIKFNNLEDQKDTGKTPARQSQDRDLDTTIYPNPNTNTTNVRKPSPRRKNEEGYTDSFLQFWEAYPRKEAKGKAFDAWKKIPNATTVLSRMLETLSWQVESDQWTKDDGKFIPHPTTWLNQRRWEDEKPKGVSQCQNQQPIWL